MPRASPPFPSDVNGWVDLIVGRFRGLPPPRQRRVLLCLAALAVLAVCAVAWVWLYLPPGTPYGPSAGESPQTFLGNPSDARPDPAARDNYLMVKPYYTVAYDDPAGGPRWVSWRVTAADLGTAPRKRTFDPDDTLPPGFDPVTTRMYTGDGFDRGHMCPHSDRAADEQMSYATFVMTNILPQAPNVNRKAWAQFEEYCRRLVRSDHDRLYVVAGGSGRGGRGSRGPAQTIGGGRVVVPARCWKVVVAVPDRGVDDPAEVAADGRVIAVDMPNDDDQVGEAWAGFRCSPAAIEAETGLRFFTRLPPAVRAELDARVDRESVPEPTPMFHTEE